MSHSTPSQRAKLHTSAGALASTSSLQSASATASTMSSVSKFGRASKWALVGTTVLALAGAGAMEMRNRNLAKTKQTNLETDQRYQQLLDAYGSGESLDELEKAVASYDGSDSRS